MDSTQMSAASGLIISLLCSYLPGLKTRYQALASDAKSLIMLCTLVVVAAGTYLLSCSGWATWVTCDKVGIQALITNFIAALVANQATYLISPQKPT